jgi:hypothetical protein
MSTVGRAWQHQGGYDLPDLVPCYRMVCFGSHVTQSERAEVDKLLPDKCRIYIGKTDYFRTTLSPTNGGELKKFSHLFPLLVFLGDCCPRPVPVQSPQVIKKTSGFFPGLLTNVRFSRRCRPPGLSLLSCRGCSQSGPHFVVFSGKGKKKSIKKKCHRHIK